MKFQSFALVKKSEVDNLESFEIVTLNSKAQNELFSVLADKKLDCTSKESKKQLAENPIFTSFIKKTLQPLDPQSKNLSTPILQFLIQDFMDNSYTSPTELSKILARSQLSFIISQSKMPKAMEDELNNTIAYYLEQYPDSYPFTKLIGFIKSKHSSIHSFLSIDRLRDYISLSFIISNSLENFTFASYELAKKIESPKVDSEIYKEICALVDSKLRLTEVKLEKILVLKDFYENFLLACQNPKKGQKEKMYKIMYFVNIYLIEKVFAIIKSLKEDDEQDRKAICAEEEIKEMILKEQLKVQEYFTRKVKKYSNYQKEIQGLSESQLISKQNLLKSQIFELFTDNSLDLSFSEKLLHSSKTREKTLEKIQIKTQELFFINSLQDLKINKTKNLFKTSNSVSDLLKSDFLQREEELYRKNRELSMRVKLVENENQRILERKLVLNTEDTKSLAITQYLEIILVSIVGLLLGIVVHSLLGYLKILEL